ncbi:IS200/IS605 family transposase [Acinetobacter johnsonii]|uniref:IS200/IS605 family transposase n=1 Tax=Acinetobacter johnsonii TaxID=40214 RepID=UPI002446A1F2|nr:IS200/IS605 family transposase [Acinetobacter johnsonii]MDH0835958.1 IS200/IS605 family transposase [Acinetobacter johnsonii]MDH0839581.1 IS200/IS605 family transposase [Acinetobacter johnsonii]WQE01427.1 IS200/IS605 family transposase [Acinetobacter johnsonii]
MSNSQEIRTGRHCVFNMHVHLVFVAKYRRDVFTKAMLETMREVFERICLDFETELVEFDGEHDHVHLLVNYPPKIAISSLVNSLKGASSRIVRTKHPEIKNKLWGSALWSPSYFAASCGGAPIGIVKQYIQQQQTPH